jgi:hypothetical protein
MQQFLPDGACKRFSSSNAISSVRRCSRETADRVYYLALLVKTHPCKPRPLSPAVADFLLVKPHMESEHQMTHERFCAGWKDKSIGLACLDGYTNNLLFAVIHDRWSRIGWRLAKWVHRGTAICALILVYRYSWWWMGLFFLAFLFRRAYYEEARREIANKCVDDQRLFDFVRSSGLAHFHYRNRKA